MHIVTAGEMRSIDRYTIDQIGIPALVLMENAGREAARVIQTVFLKETKPLLILVGKGNNGGDGVVAARHLIEAGLQVEVLFVESPELLTGEAAVQRDISKNLGIAHSVFFASSRAIKIEWSQYGGVIDALLGTGAKGVPREPYRTLIQQANESGLRIVAIDIPSGIDADTGALYDPYIHASYTVALAFLKRGLVTYPAKLAAGRTEVVPIGIPTVLPDKLGVHTFLLTDDVLEARLGVTQTLQRKPNTHKGSYGHLLVVAGSRRMSGAGFLCSEAAFRTGCGLVTWAVPDRLADSLPGHFPEVMLAPIPDAGEGDWSKTSPQDVLPYVEGKSAIAIGPGLGKFPQGEQWIRTLWDFADCAMVLDADALNMIADDFSNWPHHHGEVVFTPHPGEMARLTKLTINEVQSDRIEIARQFAIKHAIVVVLKGAATVIATPDGTAYVNPTGNPGMAKGGTGDVLTGIIASLLAQGYSAKQAACLGTYIHGRAGDTAAIKLGESCLLASDIIEELEI